MKSVSAYERRIATVDRPYVGPKESIKNSLRAEISISGDEMGIMDLDSGEFLYFTPYTRSALARTARWALAHRLNITNVDLQVPRKCGVCGLDIECANCSTERLIAISERESRR
jgi:hypothetical protein